MASVDQVILKHRQIRQELKDKRKEFEEYETKAKKDMHRLEVWLMDQSKKTGVKSFSTDVGTAFRTTKDYVRLDGPEGWMKLCEYVQETSDFSVFEKRCAKNHIKELMAEGGMKPSELGITYEQEVVMQVRAPSK